MKTLTVIGKTKEFRLTLPENLSEISNEYLLKCTDFVHCAPNYAIVAIVYKDSLSYILTALEQKKPTNVSVVPIFIKAGENSSKFILSLSAGTRCVVAASDLSIGHHINSPYNKITPSNVSNILKEDNSVHKQIYGTKSTVCFVEFKLIPISAIHAALDETNKEIENPFIEELTNKILL